MTMYALVDPSNQINRVLSDAMVDPTVPTKLNWRWLPIQPVGDVAYDPATQTKDGPVYSVLSDRITATYAIRNKTPAELDAERDFQVTTVSLVMLRALFNHENRIRALESKQPITVEQFRTALKALL